MKKDKKKEKKELVIKRPQLKHSDEKEDKAMIKKMVKKGALK